MSLPVDELKHDQLQQEKQELEARLRGSEIEIVFVLPGGADHKAKFNIGQSIDMLKAHVDRECGIDYSEMQLFFEDNILPDPLSLSDFPFFAGKTSAVIRVVKSDD